MPLTEEQQERIRKNRERALEIQRKRKEEQEKANAALGKREGQEAVDESLNRKRPRVEGKNQEEKKRQEDEEEDDDLEPFEEGASDLVAKGEAKKMYCLPEGTLAVCSVVEKDNPRHKGWSKMKLYYRSELRRRARKRFGGKEGLIAERNRRLQERFRKDVEKTKNIFKK